jgi:putative tail protein
MSNQQIGTVVGAAIGFFVPVVGVALGAAIGGAVGTLLTDGEKTEGPRLDDLKVSFSTYGVGIPLLYGTDRLGGNCVWSTDKLEIANTEGGKGSPPEHTSYKYYVHQRYVLCETPRDGSIVQILQILIDGKLQWDVRSGIPLGSALASAENLFVAGRLWQGDEDQLPDGNEEPWEGGPGSVAAYRGVVSYSIIAFECPNGRVPQLSFVITVGAGTITEKLEMERGDLDQGANQVFSGVSTGEGFVYYVNDDYNHSLPYTVSPHIGGAGYVSPGTPISTADLILPTQPIPVQGSDPAYLMLAYADTDDQTAGLATVYRVELLTGEQSVIGYYTVDPGNTHFVFKWAAFDPTTATHVLVPNVGESPTSVHFVGPITGDFKPVAGYGAASMYDGVVSSISVDGETLTRYDTTTDVVTTHAVPIPVLGGTIHAMVREDSNGVFIMVLDSLGDGGIWKWTSAGFTLLSDDIATLDADLSPAGYEGYQHFYADDAHAVVGPNHLDGDIYSYTLLRFNVVEPEPVKVSDIIADLCERAGETRYDVSEIPDGDVVHGYKISSVASVRANVEPLMTAFGIYVVDEDGLIKFRKREDLVSVATVSYDELGQAEDGGDPGDPLPLNHTQEIDLPRSATVSYIEPEFDYQVASETFGREIATGAIADIIIDLPVALTSSDQAKRVAQLAVFERSLAQNTRSCKLSRKYAFVSPGDGLTIEYPRGTSRLYFVASTTDTGALCEFNLQPGDAQLLTQTAVGATGYPSQDVSPLAPPTKMVLLDSPIMRDEDNNAGLYVAAEGFGPSWRGYTLWVGDDDTNLEDRGTVTTTVPIGFAESALGDWSYNMIDGQNSVVLNMGDDVLSSTTEALLMTSRVNLALIGSDGRWEAIQFMTSSSLGSGRYLIYGLLRGLYGTERFRGTHEANDKFVLITQAGMLRPNQDVGSLGQERKYRPVSLGRSKDSVASQTFANTGIGLLPYSPWDARKSKAASNDQTITWERRSRLSTNSLRGIVPLGEATESYSIEFYTSSAFTTLAGTLTSTTKSLTITSAQQTAFGLTPGATLYVHISQVSDIVGAGAPLEATL